MDKFLNSEAPSIEDATARLRDFPIESRWKAFNKHSIDLA
jgi:hypothetical protein